jgi:catechol 2,3-dioxygenase-like lactoylglutathione lyase family enzyme
MAKLLSAYGYQGDAMNLPVANVDAAIPFYLEKMGFSVAERTDDPLKKAVLERDGIQFAIAENGGNPEQDGCAFHTDDVHGLWDEFRANGYAVGEIDLDIRPDGSKFQVFFAIAPDGLCYWFGESAS